MIKQLKFNKWDYEKKTINNGSLYLNGKIRNRLNIADSQKVKITYCYDENNKEGLLIQKII